MNEDNLYKQAYLQLQRCTPRRFDCGRLCNRACCRDLEETREREAGMWLFPGEETVLAGEPGFQIMPLQRQLASGRPLLWLKCAGKCNRAKRPLACRIFPLTPVLTQKEIIVVKLDPRARPLCPLAEDRRLLEPEFIRNVGQVCRKLGAEPEIREFFGILTREIDEYRRLADLFNRRC